MKALLTRDKFYPERTLGIFELIDDTGLRVFSCFTCEDTARADGVKINTKTCIPEGKYLIDVNFSNRFQKMMPIVYNQNDLSVKDDKGASWSGIRIHPGNTEADTDGCILVGSTRDDHEVLNSRETFGRLFPIINSSKKPMEFEIVNEQKI